MKKIIALMLAAAAILPVSASSFKLKDLLGGSSTGNTITNLIEGVFTTSNLEISDLAGVWTVTGSAVTFQSENLLAKAGGLAGAATIESQLDPYFKQYGLTGGVFTIQTDGTFEFKMSRMTLKGKIEKLSDGNFNFIFQAFGQIKLGDMTTYVEKSPSSLNIMFDATKLKKLVSAAATISGSKLAKTGSELLTKYDGICVGFKMSQTGTVSGSENTSAEEQQSVGSGLLNILTGGKKK